MQHLIKTCAVFVVTQQIPTEVHDSPTIDLERDWLDVFLFFGDLVVAVPS